MINKPMKYFIYIIALALVLVGCQESTMDTDVIETNNSTVIEKSYEDVLLHKRATASSTDSIDVIETNSSSVSQSTTETSIDSSNRISIEKEKEVTKVSLSYSSRTTIEMEKDIAFAKATMPAKERGERGVR